MWNPRHKALIVGLVVLILAWGLVGVGYVWAKRSRMTAEKVQTYLRENDLNRLAGERRARALRELAEKINALPYEERRRSRLERQWQPWFEAMTEGEKAQFLEATMPAGFKQMLTAFEQMTEEKRKRAVSDALKRLKEAQESASETEGTDRLAGGRGTNHVVLSPELEQRVRNLGLKTFYSEASAQTKAELAPVLEEIQRLMESGRALRGGRH